jgi:hypothetical protein
MSVQAISWVLDHSESRLGARCVLIAIANHAGPNGQGSWPSVKTIAKEAKLSEREVQYAKAELKRIGELQEQIGGGPKGANLYSLPKMGANSAPGAQGMVEGCTGKANGVHPGAPEPSKSEPLNSEPSKTFCAFWELYPRKVGRTKSEKLWQGLNQEQHLLAIRGLRLWRQAEQWNRDDGKFIPYASTFLAQRRWEDEPWTGAFTEAQQV